MSDNRQAALFTKDEFLSLKGIAIILMLIHHLFTYPDWYIDGISYKYSDLFSEYFCWNTKICVGIFAFLTGYAYVYNPKPNYKYSIRKIRLFLINYWIVYIPLLVLCIVMGYYHFNLSEFILGLFGLSSSVMIFCWYVYFYVFLLLMFPLLKKGMDQGIIQALLYGVVTPIVIFFCGCKFIPSTFANGLMTEFCLNAMTWTPCASIGYIVTKYDLLYMLENFFKTHNLNRIYIYFTIIIAVLGLNWWCSRFFWNVYYIVNPAAILTPLFLFSIIALLRKTSFVLIHKFLIFCGKQSMNIWFLHCIFFNCAKNFFQPIAYWLQNPLLVLFWVLGLCSLISLIIENAKALFKKAIIRKNPIFKSFKREAGF